MDYFIRNRLNIAYIVIYCLHEEFDYNTRKYIMEDMREMPF